MSNSPLVCYTKLSPFCSPRTAKIDTVTIHCMAGNGSIEGCGELFTNAATKASSNYGIGSDGRIGLYVPEDVLSGKSGCDFIGIMLEFNKRVYLDGDGKVDEEKATVIRDVIKKIIVDCVCLGSVENTVNQKLYGLKSQVTWKTLNTSVLLDQEKDKE